MTTHELKSWPEYFEPILNGAKTFELRKNDRDYQVFDLLHLREYEPATAVNKEGHYTGRYCYRRVTYVLDGVGPGAVEPAKGLLRGYVIMSLVYSDSV